VHKHIGIYNGINTYDCAMHLHNFIQQMSWNKNKYTILNKKTENEKVIIIN